MDQSRGPPLTPCSVVPGRYKDTPCLEEGCPHLRAHHWELPEAASLNPSLFQKELAWPWAAKPWSGTCCVQGSTLGPHGVPWAQTCAGAPRLALSLSLQQPGQARAQCRQSTVCGWGLPWSGRGSGAAMALGKLMTPCCGQSFSDPHALTCQDPAQGKSRQPGSPCREELLWEAGWTREVGPRSAQSWRTPAARWA